MTISSGDKTTTVLYGLGPVAEKTSEWNYVLTDGVGIPRQLTDMDGKTTLSVRYNPWGSPIEINGTGNFDASFIGSLIDVSTSLIYIGNGQYYDPQTGRFLTRGMNPNGANPYVPWNPIGAIMAPLALISVYYSRKKGKPSPWMAFIFLALIVFACSLFQQTTPSESNAQNSVDSTQTAQGGAGSGTVATTPTQTPPPATQPPASPTNCANCTPTPTPTPMLTSGYYIPTESQARERDGGILYPIPAPTWVEDKDTYLVQYDYIDSAAAAGVAWSKNWADGFPAQYANEFLMYDYNYTCLQGSGQLDNGHYIACDTLYTWRDLFYDDASHTREDLIGFRWASEAEGGLLDSLVAFQTVAVCDTSTLSGTIQIKGLPEPSMNKLREYGNGDAIFKVADIGQGLCPKSSKDGNARVDIFTGVGGQAFKDAVLFFDKSVQVVQR